MALDPAYIRLRFPGVFDTTSDDVLNAAIEEASYQVNSVELGVNAATAWLYLACHIAALSMPGAASGVSRAKAGQVELEYKTNAAGDVQTSFLQLYNQLIKRVVLPISVA